MEEKYELSVEQSDSEKECQKASPEEDFVVPGVAIVRSNTPRPLPFSLVPARTELPLSPSQSSADFPVEAPDAPPLPEEEESGTPAETENQQPALPIARQRANEFLWLFEYALDMDPLHLNRPERLDGSAFAYGPAVLKGHRLVFEGLDARNGQVLASLGTGPDYLDEEVWGVLYRVPRRFSRSQHNEVSLLDKVHLPETFVPLEIQVRESYRQREITCITYVASEAARRQVGQLSSECRFPEIAYLKRLLQVARRQKLPDTYVHMMEELVRPALPASSALPTTPPEQNTEPLPAVLAEQAFADEEQAPRQAEAAFALDESEVDLWNIVGPVHVERWLMAFAGYVSLLLICALSLSIMQGLGLGRALFSGSFAHLAVPWYAFLYGLTGGCISCIMTLGRPLRIYPPEFVVLTWFIRPFLGAFLGALAYLALNSGIVFISAQTTQRFAMSAVVCALAGFCEGRIILRRSHAVVTWLIW